MASLMEDFIATLDGELQIYKQLVPVAERKAVVLVKGDLQEIEKITDEEQLLMEKLGVLEKKRQSVLENMALVLNRKPEELDLVSVSRILAKQPAEQDRINKLHDSLSQVAKRLVDVNQQNKILIEESLEMIEFNMNFIQSTRMSPGSNNYTRDASASENVSDTFRSFDAKQ